MHDCKHNSRLLEAWIYYLAAWIKSIKPASSTFYPSPTFLGPGGTRTYQFGGLYPGGRPDVPCQPHTITILVLVDEIRPSRHHRSLMFRDGRNLYDSRMTKAFVTTHAIAPLVCFNKVCDVTLTTLPAGRPIERVIIMTSLN